ncbi:hypothetical protein HYU18_03485 [Candidatus Woesearchaeota archaeon]|nr:hypothetical protein [Candidatus Woesearchaeota archaeon]
MKKGLWHENITDDDSLEIITTEVEDLENDQLSASEAGFLQGYEEEEAYEHYGE